LAKLLQLGLFIPCLTHPKLYEFGEQLLVAQDELA